VSELVGFPQFYVYKKVNKKKASRMKSLRPKHELFSIEKSPFQGGAGMKIMCENDMRALIFEEGQTGCEKTVNTDHGHQESKTQNDDGYSIRTTTSQFYNHKHISLSFPCGSYVISYHFA
jgi:hypothetical protein